MWATTCFWQKVCPQLHALAWARPRQNVTCHWNQASAGREGSKDGIAGIDFSWTYYMGNPTLTHFYWCEGKRGSWGFHPLCSLQSEASNYILSGQLILPSLWSFGFYSFFSKELLAQLYLLLSLPVVIGT